MSILGLPNTPYVITLTRAQTGKIEVWPIGLQDALPTVPVPLRSPDPDVPLELGAALATIYDEAAYDLSIDYSAPLAAAGVVVRRRRDLDAHHLGK